MGRIKTNSTPKRNAEPEYVPKTALGKDLLEIRKRILKSGKGLLSKEQILERIHAQRSAR